MARIRPARGQGRSGDGSSPAPGGARAPASRRQPAQPRPPQQGGRRGRTEKAGTVTKAVAQQRRGSRFINEVIAELKKVSWPTKPALMQSTGVVLVVVALVSVYLAGLDAVFERLVDSFF